MPTRGGTKRLKDLPSTLPFDKFWIWLQGHANCIMRAGTPEAVLFDDDDLHWHFSVETDETLLVQVLRGKHVLGELVLVPGDVSYVNIEAGPDDEFLFDCISEQEADRVSVYHFVLSHGYDGEEPNKPGRYVH